MGTAPAAHGVFDLMALKRARAQQPARRAAEAAHALLRPLSIAVGRSALAPVHDVANRWVRGHTEKFSVWIDEFQVNELLSPAMDGWKRELAAAPDEETRGMLIDEPTHDERKHLRCANSAQRHTLGSILSRFSKSSTSSCSWKLQLGSQTLDTNYQTSFQPWRSWLLFMILCRLSCPTTMHSFWHDTGW